MATITIGSGSSSIHELTLSTRRGDLPNATKQEFVALMLQYADHARCLKDHEEMTVELPDGRRLRFWHIVFPAEPSRNLPELREWDVHLETLNQRTPRCLRRVHLRTAWLYEAPYTDESGYKTDPSKRWCYKVWR